MAIRFLNGELSDLCLGKPALRSIPATATAAEALLLLKRSGEIHVSVWNCDHKEEADDEKKEEECRCIGKISMADVICFLCKQEDLSDSSKAFEVPISKILPKKCSIVRHLEPNSRFVGYLNFVFIGEYSISCLLIALLKFKDL